MNTWKWIEGYNGLYDVNELGQVRTHIRTKVPKLIKISRDQRGYLFVRLTREKKATSKWLHRIVAKAFCPNPALRKEVNHLDGNKNNVAASNLEWVTRSQNIRHAYDHGLIVHVGQRGEASHRTHLTDKMVKEMRQLYDEREVTQKELATKYGISPLTAHRIIRRLSWTHI